MKIKMLEIAQGRDIFGRLPGGQLVSVLEPDNEYTVDNSLGAWLIEVGKAEEITMAHLGAQPEPGLRHDNDVTPEVVDIVAAQPVMTTGRKGRHK